MRYAQPLEYSLFSSQDAAQRPYLRRALPIRQNVADDGRTENIKIERAVPSGLFERASRKAVESWQFRPPSEPLLNCRVLIRYRAGEATLGG